MLIESREYKAMVDAGLFEDLDAGLKEVRDDVGTLAESLALSVDKEFIATEPRERTIRFLDTLDFTLQQNGLLLRERIKKNGKTEYTLKCRSEDRYIAAGKNVKASDAAEPAKFEEDIGVPFVSRFSRSQTITLEEDDALAGDNYPKSLAEARRLFPGLQEISYNGRGIPPETELVAVNGVSVFERVFEGPLLMLPCGDRNAEPVTASIALITWSKSRQGRLLTAEFSFRYKGENEQFPAELAAAARQLFEGLQRLDWVRTDARTKTQFLYRG